MIRGNEALSREWASSTNQSLMMVRVSLEGLKETGKDAFNQLAQGMGANISHALISQWIGEAMKAALVATLESLAAQSITYAIYSTALGFTRLAEHDPAGAASAFTAAAIWGSVGAAAAIMEGLLRRQRAALRRTRARVGLAGPDRRPGSAVGAGNANQVPQLTVNVYGHLYGNADAVIDAINEAVMERNKTLTATNTTTGKVVMR